MPWIRSTGFGSHPSDFRRFHTAPLITCGLFAFASASSCRVNLATQMHSLARYSKRTTQTRMSVPFHVYKVSGSFYSLSRVLFNLPSRYWYAIGLETYVRLEVSASQLPAPYPGSSTQDTHAHSLLSYRYGAITLFRSTFQCTLRFQARPKRRSVTPHFRQLSLPDSVCRLRFSLAVTHRISIDFFSSR